MVAQGTTPASEWGGYKLYICTRNTPTLSYIHLQNLIKINCLGTRTILKKMYPDEPPPRNFYTSNRPTYKHKIFKILPIYKSWTEKIVKNRIRDDPFSHSEISHNLPFSGLNTQSLTNSRMRAKFGAEETIDWWLLQSPCICTVCNRSELLHKYTNISLFWRIQHYNSCPTITAPQLHGKAAA